MTPFRQASAGFAFCVAVLVEIGLAQAGPPTENPKAPSAFDATRWSDSNGSQVTQAGLDDSNGWTNQDYGSVEDGGGGPAIDFNPATVGGFTAGAEYLFVRPHFSEATAFASGTLGLGSFGVVGHELNFDYKSSIRAFLGYRFDDTGTELRFTYTRLPGQTQVNASNPGPGHFIVDPFGNVVGTAVVLDPNSALFGTPIFGGDRIHTQASTIVNVYDIDVIKPWTPQTSQWVFSFSGGVRIADVHQSYDSVISSASGAFFSGGDFSVRFVGAGPRVGAQALRYIGESRRFSLSAKTAGSLLVGEYNTSFSQTTTVPGPFTASQTQSIIRTVPVAEIEVAASWYPAERLSLTAGWLFQSWFDLGTSGGKFGGMFNVTQNSNIMSFEGLFVRGALTF